MRRVRGIKVAGGGCGGGGGRAGCDGERLGWLLLLLLLFRSNRQLVQTNGPVAGNESQSGISVGSIDHVIASRITRLQTNLQRRLIIGSLVARDRAGSRGGSGRKGLL